MGCARGARFACLLALKAVRFLSVSVSCLKYLLWLLEVWRQRVLMRSLTVKDRETAMAQEREFYKYEFTSAALQQLSINTDLPQVLPAPPAARPSRSTSGLPPDRSQRRAAPPFITGHYPYSAGTAGGLATERPTLHDFALRQSQSIHSHRGHPHLEPARRPRPPRR